MARVGVLLAVSLALLGLAAAGKDNGGVCTFPYCGCYTEFPVSGLTVSNIAVVGQTYTFTVSASSPTPLRASCAQDLYKIEINSFADCRWSKITASYTQAGVTTVIPTPTFDGNSRDVQCAGIQVLKLTRLPLTYAGIVANGPVTFTLTTGSEPGVRRCTSWSALINTTATTWSPYSVALFSSDNDCCAMPSPPPPPPPSPPPPPPPRNIGTPNITVPPPPSSFPYCRCDPRLTSSPWRAETVSIVSSGISGQTVTLRLFAAPNVVCRTGLSKIEFNLFSISAVAQYRGVFREFSINGRRSTSIQWETSRPIVKFTTLNMPCSAGAAGWLLVFNTSTPLANVCQGPACQYAAFDNPGLTGTCPIGVIRAA